MLLLLFLRDIMVDHKEFATAGKKPGLQVWRIENLDLKPIPEALRGSFYTGDAYLLLYTTSAPSYSIHMWLGRQSQALRHAPAYLSLLRNARPAGLLVDLAAARRLPASPCERRGGAVVCCRLTRRKWRKSRSGVVKFLPQLSVVRPHQPASSQNTQIRANSLHISRT